MGNLLFKMYFMIFLKRSMLEICHTCPQEKTSSPTYLHNDDAITTLSTNLCANF